MTHGEAQLRSRWLHNGAQVVLDTCGVKVFLPGISDTATLRMASDLCGHAAVKEHGQDHHTRHEVMTPDMIRQLPAGHALIVRSGYASVIARLGAAWKDRAYKTARRRGEAVAALTAADAASVPDETPDARTDEAQPPRLTIVADYEAADTLTDLDDNADPNDSANTDDSAGPDDGADPDDGAYPWS